jgi:hypothetical protein
MKFIFDDKGDFNGFVKYADNDSTLIISDYRFVESIEFYTHEFTEVALMGALRNYTRAWRKFCKFKCLEQKVSTRMAHLVSPYGHPNSLTLFPDHNPRKVYKSLYNRLSPEALKKRKEMGDNWDET